MLLADYIPPDVLAADIEGGFIARRTHPSLPLAIMNYTAAAQYDNHWTAATTRCRGLIYNLETNVVVARPFEKFFNFEPGMPLPEGNPEIWEKLDGSLITIYLTAAGISFASRGSFVSDQAKFAADWWKTNRTDADIPVDLDRFTYVFEAIGAPQDMGGFKSNRIVVRYDYEGLVPLAKIRITDGYETPPEAWMPSFRDRGFPMPARQSRTLEECLKLDQPNEEGYVAVWRKEDGPSFRLKLKFLSYVRLHRLITGCREWDVWDHHFRGESLAPLYTDTPPEFQAWLRTTEKKYVELRQSMAQEVDRELARCMAAIGSTDEAKIAQDRALKKAFAETAVTIANPAIKAAVFARVNGKSDWMKPIWKSIEPSGELQAGREDV